MDKKIKKTLTIIFFLFIVYVIISNKDLIKFKNLNERITKVYKENNILDEIKEMEVPIRTDNINKKKKSQNKVNSYNENQDDNTQKEQENQENKEIVKSSTVEIGKQKEESQNNVENQKDSGGVCLVQKSQCNTCVRKNKDSLFVCTMAYCENETYICEKFTEETQ